MVSGNQVGLPNTFLGGFLSNCILLFKIESINAIGSIFVKEKRKGVGCMAIGKYKYWISHDGLLKIEGWARDGLIDEQIAKKMGISASTLYVWKDKYNKISESLKKGKEVVDREVENALLKRALGYEYVEKTKELVKDPETGERKLVVTKEITKSVIPDVTAQIFWLKNRKPNEWRDKPVYEDTSELDKLDEILKGLKKNAADSKAE